MNKEAERNEILSKSAQEQGYHKIGTSYRKDFGQPDTEHLTEMERNWRNPDWVPSDEEIGTMLPDINNALISNLITRIIKRDGGREKTIEMLQEELSKRYKEQSKLDSSENKEMIDGK